MLDEKAWLTVPVLIHPKGVLSGWYQDCVQPCPILPLSWQPPNQISWKCPDRRRIICHSRDHLSIALGCSSGGALQTIASNALLSSLACMQLLGHRNPSHPLILSSPEGPYCFHFVRISLTGNCGIVSRSNWIITASQIFAFRRHFYPKQLKSERHNRATMALRPKPPKRPCPPASAMEREWRGM